MPRSEVNQIYKQIVEKRIFTMRKDATGKRGIHPVLRETAALRMLVYGI